MRYDLIAAYVGTLEDDRETRERYETHANNQAALGLRPLSFSVWLNKHCKAVINEATRLERLEVYLEWNGIIGFTPAIYAIATED